VTRRATLRGAERVPLQGGAARADVLICGASFAGLAVARELAGSGADVLVVDRYEIGERQTSACAAPAPWLEAMGVREAIRQELPCMAFHTPHGSSRFRLPWSWAAFDYRTLCLELWAQTDARFEIAKVEARAASSPAASTAGIEDGGDRAVGRDGGDVQGGGDGAVGRDGGAVEGGGASAADDVVVRTDRGDLRAPLVVDALGWRRVLGAGANVQPPDALISRGLEVHPDARGGDADLDVWIDRALIRYGYAWSVPAGGEQRVGVGSYEPRHHVKEPTRAIAGRLGVAPVRYQGNWFPHALRPAVEDGVFFAGDSAGHCFPLSGEGIRTAFYFGIACGRELRRVLDGSATRADALAAYGTFSASHARAFGIALRLQRLVPALPPRVLTAALAVIGRERLCRRAFTWYLEQAHPRFASSAEAPVRAPALAYGGQ
jgi:flavin-dependent dehydrogenase